MEFLPKKSYDFTTLAPAILGSNYKSMKVKGIMTSDEAVKYRDIQTLHTKLKAVITALPNNVDDCTFILFETTNKDNLLIAYEYIDSQSILLVNTTNVRIELYDTGVSDLSVLRNRMLELGYTNINLTTF